MGQSVAAGCGPPTGGGGGSGSSGGIVGTGGSGASMSVASGTSGSGAVGAGLSSTSGSGTSSGIGIAGGSVSSFGVGATSSSGIGPSGATNTSWATSGPSAPAKVTFTFWSEANAFRHKANSPFHLPKLLFSSNIIFSCAGAKRYEITKITKFGIRQERVIGIDRDRITNSTKKKRSETSGGVSVSSSSSSPREQWCVCVCASNNISSMQLPFLALDLQPTWKYIKDVKNAFVSDTRPTQFTLVFQEDISHTFEAVSPEEACKTLLLTPWHLLDSSHPVLFFFLF